MLFIEYPKCSTCQKAKKWLDAKGAVYEDRHIVEQKPTAEELARWSKEGGLPLKKFFNTSGLKYKSLGLKDKLADMSEEEQLKLLASDGMLVKRPILVDGTRVITGFKPEAWEEFLGRRNGPDITGDERNRPPGQRQATRIYDGTATRTGRLF